MRQDVQAHASLVTGNDDQDDPAWGSPPLWAGALSELPDWLRRQNSLGDISVTIDDRDCMWARDFLACLT